MDYSSQIIKQYLRIGSSSGEDWVKTSVSSRKNSSIPTI